MWLDRLRSRVVYRSLDAAVTAGLRPRRAPSANLRAIVSPRVSNYDRVGALVGLVDAVVPGTASRAARMLCRAAAEGGARIELLGFGSGATVFRVHDANRPRVLKVYRRSLGLGPASLDRMLATYRAKYEQVCTWYAGIPDLVWPGEFTVAAAPMMGLPAVVCVQDFIDQPMTDVLSELTQGQLARQVAGCGPLRRQFLAFAERTAEVRRNRCSPDLVGRHNLAIVGTGDRRRLRLIDYGVFELDGARTPEKLARIEGCLDRIEAAAREIDELGRAPTATAAGGPTDGVQRCDEHARL